MVQIQSLRRQRNYYALLFTLSVILAGWFGVAINLEATIFFGAFGIAFVILLIEKSRFLTNAELIWENRILTIPSAIISTTSGEQNNVQYNVVSTFGILIGNKIYKWGVNGINGTRLTAIKIDMKRMYMTFGTKTNSTRVELLHGMTEQKTVEHVRQKFWIETGVVAGISGWDCDKTNK